MGSITDALGTDLAHVGDLVRTPGGDLGKISGLANLKNALFHRLMTVPGSLAHRPSYGVGVGLYQNAPNSFGVQQKLTGIIQEQFAQDPRVEEVTSVSLASDDITPQLTKLAVFVKVVGYSDAIEMTFTPFAEGIGA